MKRLKLCTVIIFGLVLASAAPRAAEWPNLSGGEPQWPNIRIDDIGAPKLNKRPSFINPQEVEDRIMGREHKAAQKPATASKPEPVPAAAPAESGLDANASVAARWPVLEKQRSPFVFEGGARYWFSTGTMSFGFANGSPLFGNPTSTLDWYGSTAHSGELFARLDHKPSGVFVKGIVGGGSIADGHIDDRDFLVTQFKFSDTTSDVNTGNMRFAMFDVGWAYSPMVGMRLGFFAGYHYWHEKVTATGLVCNQASVLGCPGLNAVTIGFDTAVLGYEPTWHALRIGAESKLMITDRWSVSGEIVAIPYAALTNKDSHLLRQDGSDLGPAPNVITKSTYGYGVETELFLNYAVTPNFEVGAGVRYWGLATRSGNVEFGPSFAINNELVNFYQQRYGVLLQAKGSF